MNTKNSHKGIKQRSTAHKSGRQKKNGIKKCSASKSVEREENIKKRKMRPIENEQQESRFKPTIWIITFNVNVI